MRKIYTKGDSLLKNNSVLNKNEGGSFPLCKKCTLVVANKTTLLHGKDNTFRSGHPEVAERFDKILGKKARHGQTCQGFQHMEPSGEHDILSVCRLRFSA